MKCLLLCVALFGVAIASFAQDTIVRKDSQVILARIVEVRSFELMYKKFDKPDGPTQSIRKELIAEIRYADGKTEDYSTYGSQVAVPKKRTLPETKDFVVKTINEYGYARGSDTHRLRASFEGENLRITVLNKKNTEPEDEGSLYDFSKATKLHRVAKRGNDVGLLNIWVSEIVDVRSNKAEDVKLILEIHNFEVAEELKDALVQLRDLLQAKH